MFKNKKSRNYFDFENIETLIRHGIDLSEDGQISQIIQNKRWTSLSWGETDNLRKKSRG